MQIGMLDLFEKSIFHIMKRHKWLDMYYEMWLSVPAYHNLTPKNMSYEEVSQWNGKAIKEMRWYQLGDITLSLRGGGPAQHPLFNRTIEFTGALLEFYMYPRYKFHDDATLSYMQDGWHCFHTFKDVFLLG
jgi:hypothetical protein